MKKKLDWIDALKAFAIIGILLNHLVEEFGPGPWFTNPSNNWPGFSERMINAFPHGHSAFINIFNFIGWLGDSGPGVFILLSGLGLTLSMLKRNKVNVNALDFYKRRILRLYPLYITIHLIIIAGALFFSRGYSIADIKTLLSLLGLRFTDSLFFYINPSWWFIWLILQMYLIFPLLYFLLNKLGTAKFILLTFTFTFISRGFGLLETPYTGKLYFWMTGIFFGTRLAEFTVGMALGLFIWNLQSRNKEFPKTRFVFEFSLASYLLGLLLSFTWIGSLFSNLFVTVGLSGLFYSLWEGIINKKFTFIRKSILWIGVSSYSVYLIHQPLLQWTKIIPSQTLHITAAISILFLSFPLGWAIENFVTKGYDYFSSKIEVKYPRFIIPILILIIIISMLFLESYVANPRKYIAYQYFLGVVTLILIYIGYRLKNKLNVISKISLISTAFAAFLTLFVFPAQLGFVSVAAGIVFSLFGFFVYKWIKDSVFAFILTSIFCILTFIAVEDVLGYYVPIEAGKWGEYPAIQKHSTRTYSLIPNKTTHLKYNNYDYVLRTNSFGLASPEISVDRKNKNTLRILIIGDAFSMPEGLPYEKSYPYKLESILKQKLAPRPVQVINAGVTGYGPAEEFPQMKELGELFKPDIIVYQFFINEFYEASYTPEQRLENIGLLTNSETRTEIYFNDSQTVAHLKKLKTEIVEAVDGKSAGWRYWKALLQFYRIGDNAYYNKQHMNKLKYYLSSMKKEADKINAKFIITFVPGAAAVSKPADMNYFPNNINLKNDKRFDLNLPFQNLQKIINPLNIRVIDLTIALKHFPGQPVYFPGSWHWNEKGHIVAANEIVNTLFADGDLKSKPKSEVTFKSIFNKK